MPLIQNIFTNNNPLSLSNGSAGSDFIITTDDGAKIKSNNIITYSTNNTFTDEKELVSKKYVDDAVASGGGGSGSGFPLTQNESAGGFLITNLGTAVNSGDSLSLGTGDNRYLKLTSGTTQNITSDITQNGTFETSRLFATAGGSQDTADIHSNSGTGKALEVHKVAGTGQALLVINDGDNIGLELRHNTVANTNPALKITNASSSPSLDVGSGKIINVANGTSTNDAVNKSQLDLKADTTALSSYVLKAGDTMSGNLTIPNGTASGHAVNKSQLDLKADTTALSSYVLKAGDTMSGNLTIPNGTTSGHAVNKSQLDLKADTTALSSYVLKAGDTMSGNLTIPNGTTSGHAVNKSQLDLKADTTALSNYALLSGATFTGNITIPVATAGGHALNRDTADVRYVNTSGDTMSNTLTMSGGNIVISSGVLQQQWTSSGTNQFERPLSLGANATITQNTSAPTNTFAPSTITSLTTNNQTELATGGASQTAIGGTIATSTNNEDNAQHIRRLNSTASTTGANSVITHYRRHTTHDSNWKLMKSLTDGSATKGTVIGYALTADSHENVRLKWFSSSTVASDQDLITYTRNNITFNQAPSWGTNPSSTDHLARKAYVDSVAGNAVKTNLNNQQIVPTTPSNNNTLQVEANGVGGSAIISYTSNVSNTTATHRILNLGTGDCLRVEDSSSDTSLFRIDNNGRMGVNVGTGTLTNTFEAISQGNATSIRLNNDIELSTVADLYLGAGGQALNRPNCRITFRGNADTNFQTFYFQLGNVTSGGNGKFSFTKFSSNEATFNVCPEIRTCALGNIDSGTTATNEQLGIWADVTKASIRFLGSAKNSGIPAMDIGSQGRIINCLDPTSAQDVATKNYVDTNSIVRRYTRWSNQGVAFSWASGSNAMYYSSDGTSTLIADTDATTVLTANDRRANRGTLSTYIEFVSITNAFQQATVHCWRALIAGEYSFKFKARMNDGASNYYSQLIYRDVGTGTNIRMDECWFSTDENQRRFQFYESRIYMKVNDYANFEFGNISGGVVRPITMNAHAYIEITVEYLGA